MHTDIHALSRIRTHGPSFRARKDGSCLRLRGRCDRHLLSHLKYFVDFLSRLKQILRYTSTIISFQMLFNLSLFNHLVTGCCVVRYIDIDIKYNFPPLK
jgi:hypothetical protein